MDLTLSDEQRLLRESADRFVNETYTADHRRRIANDPLGFSADIWKQFADLGWLALPIAEAYGGLGGGAIEIGILMEAFGRGLVSEPYLSTVVIGACADRGMRQRGAEAGAAAEDRRRLAVSGVRAFGTRRRASISATFGPRRRKRLTAGASTATRPPCSTATPPARSSSRRASTTATASRASSACSWCREARAASTSRDYPRLGGGRACNLDLSDVRLPADALLGDGSDALPAIEAVVDRAMAALGAEAVGIMQTLLDQTLEYTKIRKQFGRPLSANQVIRHRLADMAMQCDEARSMALRAALMADAEPVARSRAASGAKAKIGKCARFVAEQSVQLHGAMGVTEELDIGSYFKRLLAFDTLFGGSAHHYRRHAALGGRAVQA